MSERESPMIRCENVCRGYTRGGERLDVLAGLDLTIERGEFVAIMGPSGSGKSTLLNLIGGLDQPDSGRLTVAGERLDTLPRRRLERWRHEHIGFVFQFYHLLAMLDASRNVELPLLLTSLSRSKRAARVRTALQLVGMSDRAKHRPGELSGGQQQRVAIARAIVTDPPLMVCDEPTGDLDRAAGDEILAILVELCRSRGTTVIMVTHDPRAARAARRTVHLDQVLPMAPPAPAIDGADASGDAA